MTIPAVPQPAAAVWRALSPAALYWTHWEASSSLFNADTGETHLLDALPAEIVRLLCQRPWSVVALSRHLAQLCDTVDDCPWQSQVLRILAELADLELIESCPAEPSRASDSPLSPIQAVG